MASSTSPSSTSPAAPTRPPSFPSHSIAAQTLAEIPSMAGRVKTAPEQFLFSRIFDAIPLAKCSTCGQCATQLTSILLNAVRKEEMVKTPLLFDQWSPSIRATSLCEGCKQVLLERNQAERQRTWDSLPQVFEITVESWAKSGGAGAPAGAA